MRASTLTPCASLFVRQEPSELTAMLLAMALAEADQGPPWSQELWATRRDAGGALRNDHS